VFRLFRDQALRFSFHRCFVEGWFSRLLSFAAVLCFHYASTGTIMNFVLCLLVKNFAYLASSWLSNHLTLISVSALITENLVILFLLVFDCDDFTHTISRFIKVLETPISDYFACRRTLELCGAASCVHTSEWFGCFGIGVLPA
jgi:hypothetical protein